jgi:hypothetical protein
MLPSEMQIQERKQLQEMEKQNDLYIIKQQVGSAHKMPRRSIMSKCSYSSAGFLKV